MEPNDPGPMYAETAMGRFPVEPWNTASNLIFLFVIIFWAVRVWRSRRRHPILTAALPMLAVGFVGGTLYHATRASAVWFVMDYVGIFVMVFVASLFLWFNVFGRWLPALATLLGLLVVSRGIMWALGVPRGLSVSLGYAVLGLAVAIPAAIDCVRRRFAGSAWLVAAAVALAVAIFLRQVDMTWGRAWFPMGSHFLWHLLGGAATFFFIGYIYGLEESS